MTYFIYILECKGGRYYTGYTTDIARRYREHVAGTAKSKFTRSFPPLCIAACWEICANLSLVLKLENSIKKLTREDKKQLITSPSHLTTLLTDANCLTDVSGKTSPSFCKYVKPKNIEVEYK